MFVYQVSTGKMFRAIAINSDVTESGEQIADTGMWGVLLGIGYSGRDFERNGSHILGRNQPACEGVSNIGPLPRGGYTIGLPESHPVLGPLAMPLQPDPDNKMYGRGDFWIHGDNAEHNASHGCIVLAGHHIREEIAAEVEKLNNALMVLA